MHALQDAFIEAVRLRFPTLVDLARRGVTSVEKPEHLNSLLEKISVVSDEPTVRLVLSLISA